MSVHTIKLIATIDRKVEASPDASILTIAVGDTIKFVSDHGAVQVDFEPADRFSAPSFGPATSELKAVKKGPFTGRCSIKLVNGEEIGWKTDKTSGSNGEVVDGAGNGRRGRG